MKFVDMSENDFIALLEGCIVEEEEVDVYDSDFGAEQNTVVMETQDPDASNTTKDATAKEAAILTDTNFMELVGNYGKCLMSKSMKPYDRQRKEDAKKAIGEKVHLVKWNRFRSME